MSGLRAVLFDAGNTLLEIDYGGIIAALTAEGIRVAPDALRAAECRARVRLDPVLRVRSTESREVFRSYFAFTAEALGLPLTPALDRAWAALQEQDRRQGLWRHADPDARAVLEALAGEGYRLAVISNADGRVEATLERLGLGRWAEFVLDSALVGVEKPDPRIFRLALERMGLAPAEAVYVGDFYAVDILGARAAGMEGILLDPVGAWDGVPCLTVRRLADIPALLRDRFPLDSI